jgi:molybdopterin-guanine dinucleotide biosynthesis protein A
MTAACTGVILAGGQNKRFGGQNKAFLRIGEKRIVDRLMDVFGRLFDQVVLVTNDPAAYTDVDALIVTDHFATRSSLNGLHAGLFAAAHETAFFGACDTPFATEPLIRCVLGHVEPNADIVIPATSAGFEPLFAVYRKRCLPAMAQQLRRDRLKIQDLFRKVRIKAVDETELRRADPELISFFNVNTPEDLKRAQSLRKQFEKEP